MPQLPFNPADLISAGLRRAATEIGLDASFDPLVRAADPRFGDFQANGVLPAAKALGQPPRPLAEKLMRATTELQALPTEIFDWSIAGPGFVNFSLKADALLKWMQVHDSEAALRKAAGSRLAGSVVVIDFSSPNTAKEMHVGHIRSTVIGESIARLLTFAGAAVIRDNHIGDWGTQFGMLIWAIKQTQYDLHQADPSTAVADLEALYKQGHAAYKESDEQANQIRQELVQLQNGDPVNTAIWKAITDVSWKAFQIIYDQLGISFDEVLGESFYRDQLDSVFAGLDKAGICEESDGALVVFHHEHKRFAKQPFIVRKSDGASNYATTDLATVLYRVTHFHANRILYVVDSRQSDHFEQLFLTVQKWFSHENVSVPQLQHISFGSVLGENGKPIKTKEGGSIKLRELLNEAVQRAATIVQEKNPDLPAEEAAVVARTVGLGAIRYADLSQNRTSDYLFSWDKMLSFEGNTAPYLLYAVARIHSIFRKANIGKGQTFSDASAFETSEELALARKLLAFPGILDMVLADLRPHVLCTYLFELAGAFSSFYNANKVIIEEPAIRERRLLLCDRTRIILETGLHLLGLETVQKM
jgi:arginyl-tRNA synthetase